MSVSPIKACLDFDASRAAIGRRNPSDVAQSRIDIKHIRANLDFDPTRNIKHTSTTEIYVVAKNLNVTAVDVVDR
jgi:hypothetical protein